MSLVFTGGALRGRYISQDPAKTQQQLEIRFDGKSNALNTVRKTTLAVDLESLTYRKLTPLECERLQTVPDGYTEYGKFHDGVKSVSNSQRYKMLGNGWTVDVIAHIMKGME